MEAGTEMEEYGTMLSQKEINELTARVVKEYFEEHNDSTIISFGKAGSRIIKRMLPFESGRTNFHTVDLDRETMTSKPKGKGRLIRKFLKRSSYLEVDLDGSSININRYRNAGVSVESIYYKVSNVNVRYDKFLSSPRFVANEILSNIEKSSMFILVTGFGGAFGQTMHTEFARMLKKRKIPHLNVVIKPSRLERQRRSEATRAITELMKEDSNVIVYDNEEYIDKNRMFDSLHAAEITDGINEKIGMDIWLYNLRLTDQFGILKDKSDILSSLA